MVSTTTIPVKSEEKAAPPSARRWDPIEIIDEIRADLARFWNEGWPFIRMAPPPSPTGLPWLPRMDVFEKNGNLVVKTELPGLSKDDIHVSVVDNNLVIRGERKTENEVKEEAYYRVERSYGSFYRRLPLPSSVTPESIKAEYKDGVLEVQIPKPAEPEAKAKQIPIT